MTKVAVVFADGCEEVEGLSVVDVLRRLNIDCDMVGLDKKEIDGDHHILLTCDKVVDDSLLDYDLVAFPGGRTGALNLRNNKKLADLMIQRNKAGKWDAAMCAAPIALGHYGLLEGANYTCYQALKNKSKKNVQTVTLALILLLLIKNTRLSLAVVQLLLGHMLTLLLGRLGTIPVT